MTTEEKILLTLSFAALAAIVVFKKPVTADAPLNPIADVGSSILPSQLNSGSGPAYLVANASPWAFSPPVQNILPTLSAGSQNQLPQRNVGAPIINSCLGC